MNKLSNIITNENQRENLIKDLLNAINDMGVSTPKDGYISIERQEDIIKITIPIDVQSNRISC